MTPVVFDFNFRDDRYLPFEGAGAISQWRLELPSRVRLLDYNSISDVIIHLSYTAKDSVMFRTTVEDEMVDALTTFATDQGLYRLLSLKHEFPNAYSRLDDEPGAARPGSGVQNRAATFPIFSERQDAGDIRGHGSPEVQIQRLRRRIDVDHNG